MSQFKQFPQVSIGSPIWPLVSMAVFVILFFAIVHFAIRKLKYAWYHRPANVKGEKKSKTKKKKSKHESESDSDE